MANWQRKSDYLLREIVKFQTYAEALAAAQGAREEVERRRAREAEVLARRGVGSRGSNAKRDGEGEREGSLSASSD